MKEILPEISVLRAGRAAKKKLRKKLARFLKAGARDVPSEDVFSGLDRIVEIIRDCNDKILSIPPEEMADFLSAVIADEASRANLRGLFSGSHEGEGGCIRDFARVENDAIERLNGDGVEKLDSINGLMETLSKDIALCGRFVRDLRALYREGIEFGVIGYGEISTVFSMKPGRVLGAALEAENVSSTEWIYKKMPPFKDRGQVERYVRIYGEYREILTKKVGLKVPAQCLRVSKSADGKFAIYAGQAKCGADTIGNAIVRRAGQEMCSRVFRAVLGEIAKLARHNRANPDGRAGLDGQVSNWSVVFDSEGGAREIFYLDTSTPLYRVGGEEQLDAEIILQTTPGPLRWIIRKFMLKGVLDRYYETRLIVVDLVANFIKEGRGELVPELVRETNLFFESELSEMELAPLSADEIFKYYKSDAMIWRFFQFSRRVDRFFTEKILRREYGYRLPGKIER